MASWHSIEPFPYDQAIDETSTVQKLPLGTIVRAHDASVRSGKTVGYGSGEFIYLQGIASTVATDLVSYHIDNFVTTRAQANQEGPLALAMSANVASQYGGYQITGLGIATGDTGDVADKPMYLHATAGKISDAIVAGDLIDGMISVSALDVPSTGKIEVMLSRPHSTNASN